MTIQINNLFGNVNIYSNEHEHCSLSDAAAQPNDTPKPSNEAPVAPCDILPIPHEGKYTEVRRYIEERKRFDEEFKSFCNNRSLRDLCGRLTEEFGWFVDENSLQKNLNRNRK